jgi:HAD superfamily hydrolase (TIGR01549 family)
MKIKAVLYDLGDIFFEAHYWRLWNYEEARKLNCFDGVFAEFYDLYESFLVPVYQGKMEYEKCFADFIHHLKIPHPEEFMQISFLKKKEFETGRVLFPGVRETLAVLFKAGIKNIVITDNELGEDEIKEKVIGRFGITPYLTGIVSSKSLGISKPDPTIYIKSMELYNLGNEDVLFVGHDKDEIEGANKVGIKTILFNNYLKKNIDSAYSIDNFSDILSIVL